MIPSIFVALTVALGGFSVATRRDHAVGACIAAIEPDPSPHRRLRPLSQVVSAVGMSRAARLPGRLASLREGWEAAGRPATFDAVLGARLLLATAGLIVGLAAAMGTPLAILLAPILGLAASRLPDIALVRLAKRRTLAITAHVPDLVELLVSTTEAGLNPLIAFHRAAEVLGGPLGEELRVTARQIELGLPWRTGLDQLAARTRVPSLRRLVIALGRSARLGTTIGSTLRSVAVDLRGERRARAEELARRAPIKMLFPLVFLILPAFLLLTVGPVVLATLRSLH